MGTVNMSSNRTKHGYAPLVGKRKPVYVVWQGMNNRCFNPNRRGYKNYGGRGITVCERWIGPSGFINFLEDMGEPAPGMSIERINVNGNYEPSNCKWIPRQEQALNRRYNWTVLLDGKTVTAVEATRQLGLDKGSIALRLRRRAVSKTTEVDARALLVAPPRYSEHKGVTYHRARKKWQAQATVDGKSKMIGRYNTEAEAVLARTEFDARTVLAG